MSYTFMCMQRLSSNTFDNIVYVANTSWGVIEKMSALMLQFYLSLFYTACHSTQIGEVDEYTKFAFLELYGD